MFDQELWLVLFVALKGYAEDPYPPRHLVPTLRQWPCYDVEYTQLQLFEHHLK